MSNMRGLDTQVRTIRRRVFKEVAKLGFEANSETLLEDMEAIPYEIVNDDTVSTERVRIVPVRSFGSDFVLRWDFPCARKTSRYI